MSNRSWLSSKRSMPSRLNYRGGLPFRLAVRQILPKSEHMKKFGMEEEGADPAQIMAMDSDNSESLGL